MNPFELDYPILPYLVEKRWGAPEESEDLDTHARHAGIDLRIEEDQLIYAPFDAVVTKVGEEGGAYFLTIVSAHPYTFPDGMYAFVELTFKRVGDYLARPGDSLRVGSEIARGPVQMNDKPNSVHIAPKRVHKRGSGYRAVDKNATDGTFDLEPFWTGDAAVKADEE